MPSAIRRDRRLSREDMKTRESTFPNAKKRNHRVGRAVLAVSFRANEHGTRHLSCHLPAWEAEQAGMSCVDITNDMATLLVALRSWPHADLEAPRTMPEWKLAQNRGWITEAGELTESGARHAGLEVRPGVVQ